MSLTRKQRRELFGQKISNFPWQREQDVSSGQWDILSYEGKLIAVVHRIEDAILIEHSAELCGVLEELLHSEHTVGDRALMMKGLAALAKVRDVVGYDGDGAFNAVPLQPETTITPEQPVEITRAQNLYRRRNTITRCSITWQVIDHRTKEVLKEWKNEKTVGGHLFLADGDEVVRAVKDITAQEPRLPRHVKPLLESKFTQIEDKDE